MNDSKISVRYAKALFLTAKEAGEQEKVTSDIKLIKASLSEPGFREFLESPVITGSGKKKVISSVFEKHLSRITFGFLNLLLKNKRENYLEGILRDFEMLYREDQGIKLAKLSVPFSVSEEYQQKFKKLLADAMSTKIELVQEIKPDIIGGFILKVEDHQFDASVKTQLARIKKKLLETE